MNCTRSDMLLYALTADWQAGDLPLAEQVEAAIRGGATMIQLREKKMPREELRIQAQLVMEVCRRCHVPFILNDDVELAAWLDADGVHVGQSDMAADAARKRLGPNKIIGVSARTVGQALLAQEQGADYLGVGAVFATGSKNNAKEIDWNVLRDICAAVSIPVAAIGGISADNISELTGTGIDGVAVISAIFGQENIEAAAADMKRRAISVIK